MRLNKKLQYALLLVLYVCRSGRVTLESASIGLSVSKSFLEQIARDLRLAKVLKSTRGPNGGYELVGEPRVSDVFNAVSPTELLNKEERTAYIKGDTEHRALLHYVKSLEFSLLPFLKKKVRSLGTELVASELSRLDKTPNAELEN